LLSRKIDSEETLTPIVKLVTNHDELVIPLATHFGCIIYEMDVKSAFFNGPWRKRFICINLKVFRFLDRSIWYADWLGFFMASNRGKELVTSKLTNICRIMDSKGAFFLFQSLFQKRVW
jgi:hypothetical protein